VNDVFGVHIFLGVFKPIFNDLITLITIPSTDVNKAFGRLSHKFSVSIQPSESLSHSKTRDFLFGLNCNLLYQVKHSYSFLCIPETCHYKPSFSNSLHADSSDSRDVKAYCSPYGCSNTQGIQFRPNVKKEYLHLK
jgi:hypothetical protein